MTTVEWVKLASFASGLEADIARATLEGADIPVQARGDRSGIYGSAFQGTMPGGVELYVPSPDLAHARDLLSPTA